MSVRPPAVPPRAPLRAGGDRTLRSRSEACVERIPANGLVHRSGDRRAHSENIELCVAEPAAAKTPRPQRPVARSGREPPTLPSGRGFCRSTEGRPLNKGQPTEATVRGFLVTRVCGHHLPESRSRVSWSASSGNQCSPMRRVLRSSAAWPSRSRGAPH